MCWMCTGSSKKCDCFNKGLKYIIMDLEAGVLINHDGPVAVPPAVDRVQWKSCCFSLDRSFVQFCVQTVLGASLLAFSAFRLTTEPDCDRAAPYWGLIGTLCGFFFNKISGKRLRRPERESEST